MPAGWAHAASQIMDMYQQIYAKNVTYHRRDLTDLFHVRVPPYFTIFDTFYRDADRFTSVRRCVLRLFYIFPIQRLIDHGW